jgi:hypothetical protein
MIVRRLHFDEHDGWRWLVLPKRSYYLPNCTTSNDSYQTDLFFIVTIVRTSSLTQFT